MKPIFLTILFFSMHQAIFSQIDSISVSSISFSSGIVQLQDTTIEVPVMHVEIAIDSLEFIGDITLDIMNSDGTVLILKKNYSSLEVANSWLDGVAVLVVNEFLDPEQNYLLKTTIQTPDQLYLPQLINTYP